MDRAMMGAMAQEMTLLTSLCTPGSSALALLATTAPPLLATGEAEGAESWWTIRWTIFFIFKLWPILWSRIKSWNEIANVQGPARVADTQGEGYGGGASYKDNDGETLGVGLPGVVLIEIGELWEDVDMTTAKIGWSLSELILHPDVWLLSTNNLHVAIYMCTFSKIDI